MSTSFKRQYAPEPFRYRTPSPPRQYVEPLSPRLDAAAATTSRKQKINGKGLQSYYSGTVDKAICNGGREVMDVFASIALATIPDHHRYISHATGKDRGTTRSFADCMERPSKRARSEKLASPDLQRIESRPVTSYIQPTEDRRFEAELLLNFSREACLAVPRRPTHYAEQSASYVHTLPPLQSPVPQDYPTRDYGTSSSPAAQQHVRPDHNTPKDPDISEKLAGAPGIVISSAEALAIRVGDMDGTTANMMHITTAGYEVKTTEPLKPGSMYGNLEECKRLMQQPGDNIKTGHRHDPTSILDFRDQSGEDNNVIKDRESMATLFDGFLQGIDEAAIKQPITSRIGSREAMVEPQENKTTKKSLPMPSKEKHADAPSICAACNFSRNSLNLETEYNATSWISCDGCKSWFHFACAGFKNEREVRAVDKFRCRNCRAIHGPTTYVRKSARPHSAIDYAGLNEGVLKTSDESPQHHYIKPIREGTIKFNPENFARMRPELVTADYFQKGDGMKEPVIIPAVFNPRPRRVPNPTITLNSVTGLETTDEDGIHDQSVLNEWLSHGFEYELVPDNGQDALEMIIPRDLTVRKVAELYGLEEKVEVIDVKSQNGEDKKWNMRRWADYYESKETKIVRNVISLEVSQSKLGRLIQRPKVVRDLDLQDAVWPADLQAKGDYPKVQFYCLMSVADCFTDFHIDFGGSSVYYHILQGRKTFFFIPPHEKHLRKYEEWCMSPAQNWTFLGDQTKECYRVDLSEGDTMLIPAGWIHAVWTPEDSLVIGGNFLTAMHYPMQIRVAQIEKATGVARKFRYPHFQKLLWYTALRYLDEDPIPLEVVEALLSGQTFVREQPTYLDFDVWGKQSQFGAEDYHARYYSKAELDGLPELARYLQRTALIATGNITEGISVETRRAVSRSIPKGHGHGEPLEAVKKFAWWYTWKRGNEPVPHWAYPDYVPEGGALELTEKKLSAAALRRLEREAALQAWRVAPDRQSLRGRKQPQNLLAEILASQAASTNSPKASPPPSLVEASDATKPKPEGPAQGQPSSTMTTMPLQRRLSTTGSIASRRPACAACRRGRRACKHRDELPPLSFEVHHHDPVEDSITVSSPSKGLTEIVPVTQETPQIPPRNDRSPLLTLNLDAVQPGAQGECSITEEDSANLNILDGSTGAHNADLMRTPGRSKACKDCRKSKRRCVHDEFGNEDPIKLASASIPRPAAKKRKVSDEGGDADAPKSKKIASPRDASYSKGFESIEEQPQTAVRNYVVEGTMNQGSSEHQAEGVSEEIKQSLPSISQFADESHLVVTSPLAEFKFERELADQALSSSPHLAHRPASSLVSPPESTHTDAEQTPPMSRPMTGMTPPATTLSSRHSSWRTQRYTPDSGIARRASTASLGARPEWESASPAPAIGGGGFLRRESKSRMSSGNEADEESLRLIKELAAQDLGLRRRAKAMS